MIKANPRLSSFSDEDLINEIIYRKYGASSMSGMQNLFAITKEEIKQIYDALVDKALDDHDINTKYAPIIEKFFRMMRSITK